MADNLFPGTISGFTEYIKVAYSKAETNLTVYGIPPEKFAHVTPYFNAYIAAEAIAANPDTATTGARRTRDLKGEELKTEWRGFVNENIRYNSSVPVADLEVFRIRKRDTIKTTAGVPDTIGLVSARTVGTCRMEVEVLNSETGKKKKPKYATGSYIYVVVTDVGQTPQHADDYRKQDFSSNCHHVLTFPLEQLGKQAHIYARYSNSHGKEGPEGPVESIVIA
jgi:hypothetical protein